MFTRVIYVLLLVFLFQENSMATHIIGGNFRYEYLEGDNYRLHLKMYRDCRPEVETDFNFDPIKIGVYDLATNLIVDSIFMFTKDTYIVKFDDEDCFDANFGCVEVRDYSADFVMTATIYNNLTGYYFSWERCCRNSIIKNVQKPGDIGMAFYMEIPSPHPALNPVVFENNSPEFTLETKSYVCLGAPFIYNFEVRDADGDDLVFSLTEPLKGNTYNSNGTGVYNHDNSFMSAGPYPRATWGNGYSLDSIMDAKSPNLTIDTVTGELTVFPTEIGAYVLSVLVEEYRNGIKIGEVRRELQFFVISCIFPSPPTIETNLESEGNKLTITVGQEECFVLTATDSNETELIEILPHSVTIGNTKLNNLEITPAQPVGVSLVNAKVCWKPPCNTDFSEVVNISYVALNKSCAGDFYDTVNVEVTLLSPPNDSPVFEDPFKSNYLIESGNNLEIPISSVDANEFDKIFIDADLSPIDQYKQVIGNIESFSSIAAANGSLFIETNCNISAPLLYSLNLFTYDSTCGGSDTTFKKIKFIVTPSYYGKTISAPTAFSPNGDGINDTYHLINEFEDGCSYGFKIVIFDRWGGIVFSTNDPNFEWDGGDYDPGVYAYLITSNNFNRRGTITLLR
ncbi:MAG: gliding motility-associated-like protein [Sphingobacteriales bacterium]|jgi:gliding motility-associated-like protein